MEREIHVSVTNGTKGAAQGHGGARTAGRLEGHARPACRSRFAHEDESLSARFQVTAPAQVEDRRVHAARGGDLARRPGEKFADGYQEIEYPHVERRQVIKPAETALKVVDVKTAPDLNVGYIVGVGDQVPPAIEQLGAKLTFIDQDELAWGDLSKYDVIMTGVRAYERRADLRAYNHRLLDYAERGGTVIVQYNKMEFNQAEYGPYPGQGQRQPRLRRDGAGEGAGARRIRCSTSRTRSAPPTWADWVQERGLYFLGEKDPKYVDLVVDDRFVQGQSRREAGLAGRRRRSARAAGSISASGCGGSCRPAPTARISCWPT